MGKQRILTAILSVTSLIALFFALGSGHSLISAATMPTMGEQMPQEQCQSSCTPLANTVFHGIKTIIDDRDIEPQPGSTQYLAFLGVGWSLVIFIGVYLMWHLRWKPPDLFSLYGVDRI